jgi:alpha-tubulin suppressor-like RCC1 family protein
MPVRVDAGPFVSLAAGAFLTCGLQTEGTVWCWGDETTTPILVQTNVRFSVLALGYRWAAGVDNWGTTSWWKPPNGGEVEYGSLLGGPYAMLAVGAKHVCGLNGNGAVYCWGDDSDGRLGRGGGDVDWLDVASDVLSLLSPDTTNTTQSDDRTKAGRVATRIPFEQIAAGYDHTCGLSGDGRVFCWGDNVKGQLGSTDATPTNKPREIEAIRHDP